MATSNKDFKVKNGLTVQGQARFNSDVMLGNTQLAFDSDINRLKVMINNQWVPIATLDDADVLTFEDIGVAIDYNGNATYIIQGNGVSIDTNSKFVDNGDPSTTTFRYIFDAGTIQ